MSGAAGDGTGPDGTSGGVPPAGPRRRVVLVSGLSGAGKASIMRALEDLGYEAVDNPPLSLVEELANRQVPPEACLYGRPGDPPLAMGVDARSRGFDAAAVLATLARLRLNPALRPELVYAWAEEAVLLRRYTETRRRHPLAPQGRVVDGIADEIVLTAALRQAADLVIDTSDLPLPALRRMVDQHFGVSGGGGMTVSLISFAYPAGLPKEADLVLDARFLRNPHYDPELRPHTGMQPEVAAYIEADPDFARFFSRICDLLALVLPRFVQEGKKYATIAIGCTGGKHRSVHLIEKLARHLAAVDAGGWRVTRTHRELARTGGQTPNPVRSGGPDLPGPETGRLTDTDPVQAQEA